MNNTAINCSRPLYFLNEIDEYLYSNIGTCFLIKYMNKVWGVTAKHNLSNHGYDVSQTLIPYGLNDPRFLPIKSAAIFTDIADERELTDLVIFEIDEDLIEEPFEMASVYSIDDESLEIDGREVLLVIHGFPDKLNYIDYDNKKLIQQRVSIFGRNPIRSTITGCVEMELTCDAELESHSGFSGAPIFIITKSEDQYRPLQLWGVSLLGSTERKAFLHAIAVKNLIKWHILGR